MKLSGFLRWISGIVLLAIVTGLLLSNYSTGKSLGVGAVIFLIVSGVYYFWGWNGITIAATAVLVITTFLFNRIDMWSLSISNLPTTGIDNCRVGETQYVNHLTGYVADVEVVNFAKESFQVTERVVYERREEVCVERTRQTDFGNTVVDKVWDTKATKEGLKQDLPSRAIQIEKNGLFIHEAVIPDLEDFAGGAYDASITIRDFPYHSFYDVRFSNDLGIDEYLGKETITWQPSVGGIENRFAYLPAPFHNLRIIVAPFIELSKYEDTTLGLIGFVASAIFLLIVKPNVIGFINEKIRKTHQKEDEVPKRKPPKRRLNRNQ